MSTTVALLDAWKSAKKIATDSEAGKRLGLSRAAISHWRHLNGEASPHIVAKMAEELGLNPIQAAARVEAARSKDPGLRKFWERVARSATMLCLAIYMAIPTYCHASAKGGIAVFKFDALYICVIRIR